MIVATPNLSGSQLRELEKIWNLQNELKPLLHEPKVWTGSLRRQELGKVVRFSTEIEGYSASDSMVQEVLLGQEPKLSEQTFRALRGYRQAMTFVLQLAELRPISLDTNLVRALHFMTLDGEVASQAGKFRESEVVVADSEGRLLHEGADWERVPGLVAEVCQRYFSPEPLVNIVQAAMIHLNMVLIHPFKDGNGRMARILQSLLLSFEEKPSPVFLSIEEQLGKNTQSYYAVLSEVGQGRWNPKVDARPWIDFILRSHLEQLEVVKQRSSKLSEQWRLVAEVAEASGLNERVVPALVHVLSGNSLSNTTYRKILQEAGDDVRPLTASRDLALLMELGLLLPQGDNRARSYLAGPKLRNLQPIRSGN